MSTWIPSFYPYAQDFVEGHVYREKVSGGPVVRRIKMYPAFVRLSGREYAFRMILSAMFAWNRSLSLYFNPSGMISQGRNWF